MFLNNFNVTHGRRKKIEMNLLRIYIFSSPRSRVRIHDYVGATLDIAVPGQNRNMTK